MVNVSENILVALCSTAIEAKRTYLEHLKPSPPEMTRHMPHKYLVFSEPRKRLRQVPELFYMPNGGCRSKTTGEYVFYIKQRLDCDFARQSPVDDGSEITICYFKRLHRPPPRIERRKLIRQNG